MKLNQIVICSVFLSFGQFSTLYAESGSERFQVAVASVTAATYSDIETKLKSHVELVSQQDAVALCRHESPILRIFAINYLVPRLEPSAADACLRQLMEDDDPAVRPYAVRSWLESKKVVSLQSWEPSLANAATLTVTDLNLLIPHLGNERRIGLRYCSRTAPPPRYQIIAILSSVGGPIRNELNQLLRHSNPITRSAAVEILCRLDGMTGTNVTMLVRMLDDPAEQVQIQSAYHLADTKTHHEQASNALRDCLTSAASENLRTQLIRCLGKLSASVPDNAAIFEESLADPSANVRKVAVTCLSVLAQTDGRLFDHLVPMLADSDTSVVRETVRCMGGAANVRPALVAHLIPMLTNSDRNIRYETVRAAGDFAKADVAVVQHILSTLNDSDPYVRNEAIRVLRESGAEAQLLTQRLIPLLVDENAMVNASTLAALGYIGPEASAAVPALKTMLSTSPNANVARALWQIEGRSESVLPFYLSILENPDLKSGAYRPAYKAIQELDDVAEEVVPVLIEVLKSEPKKGYAYIMRLREAMETLAAFGSSAKSALPELERIASSDQRHLVKQAAAAIEEIESSIN